MDNGDLMAAGVADYEEQLFDVISSIDDPRYELLRDLDMTPSGRKLVEDILTQGVQSGKNHSKWFEKYHHMNHPGVAYEPATPFWPAGRPEDENLCRFFGAERCCTIPGASFADKYMLWHVQMCQRKVGSGVLVTRETLERGCLTWVYALVKPPSHPSIDYNSRVEQDMIMSELGWQFDDKRTDVLTRAVWSHPGDDNRRKRWNGKTNFRPKGTNVDSIGVMLMRQYRVGIVPLTDEQYFYLAERGEEGQMRGWPGGDLSVEEMKELYELAAVAAETAAEDASTHAMSATAVSKTGFSLGLLKLS